MALPLAAISGAFGLAKQIAGIVDQAVTDKDLALKLNAQIYEAAQEFAAQIQTGEHVPTGVKYLYALRDVVIPLLRPVGSAALSAAAVYMAVNGIEIDPTVNALLAAAFPGWMTSRHFNKQKEAKVEKVRASRQQSSPMPWDQD